VSRPKQKQIIILMGSNIQPEVNLVQALDLLENHLRFTQISRVWESPAVGCAGPDFLNAAVLAFSPLRPNHLKRGILRPLEAQLGRVRSSDKYAPRPIDLDIAVWGKRTLDENIWRYAFAAAPVAELLPDLRCGADKQTLAEAALKLVEREKIQVRDDVTAKILRQENRQRKALQVSGFLNSVMVGFGS
jgi:2-amino-4-hydroxy-6-hydroxymethyldihydropteridine diphosphokinase